MRPKSILQPISALLLLSLTLASCGKEEIEFLSVSELHGEYNGNFEKFVIQPINIQRPELNHVQRDNFQISINRGAVDNNIRVSPRNPGHQFNATVNMIFSGGLFDVPTQVNGTSSISSTDGGLYIHNSRRLRYTIRVEKGDSVYLEVFEGIKR